MRSNDGLRQAASALDLNGREAGMEGLFVEKGVGTGAMRNRHVGWYRGGIEAAHARQAILTRTAKEWGVNHEL